MGAPSSLWTEHKEYNQWEEVAKKEMPIRYFWLFDVCDFVDSKTWKFFRTLKDTKYWFLYRLHPSYRVYWNIQPKTLTPGYYDPDWQYLHCSMHILCEFYEYTTTRGSTDWSADERHQSALSTIKEIYDWWTIERIGHQNEISQLYKKCHDIDLDEILGETPTEKAKYNRSIYDQINEIESVIDEQDTKVLHKLVDIRHFMWD